MAQKKVTNIKEVDKTKQLDNALGQIERQFGTGTVMRMGEKRTEKIPSISTGSMGLDIALGIGGLPKGRIVEIYGPESSGKTTLTLEVIAQCQKQGGTAAFIDAEHALDPVYAQKLGVNVDDLLVSQPDTGEQALEISDIMVASGAVDVGDAMANRAGDAGLTAGIFFVVKIGVVKLAAKEHHGVVTTRTEPRSLNIAIPLERNLPGLPHGEEIGGVVEGAETMNALGPTLMAVRVAFTAILVIHEHVLGDEISRSGAGQ